MEYYSSKSEVRRVKNGLISAVTAVTLKQENNPDFSEYDGSATEILSELADTESKIYQAFPELRVKIIEKAMEAKEIYPNPEAIPYLMNLLCML